MIILAAAVLMIGCQSKPKGYNLRDRVVGKSLSTNEITVKHGDIPCFMPAMTMPYKVKDPAVLQKVQPGDLIAAEGFISKDGNGHNC